MKRFDVHRNADPASARQVPYLLVLQSDLLEDFPTRVVAPLIRPKGAGGTPASLLNPILAVEEQRVVMFTQQIAGVPKRYLGKFICNVESERDNIVRALDFLFDGI